jgi:hypothetical protein
MRITINKILLIIAIAWGIFLGYYFIHRWVVVSANAPKLEVFQTGNGWGYNIKHGDRILIHQPLVPVIERNVAFPTEESARKAGNLVIRKLKKKESPALTTEDLKTIVPKLVNK